MSDLHSAVLWEGGSDRIWSLHGKMVQKKRDGMYARFSQSPTGALLCTDVAARGIDIPDIDWIIQFEPPQVRRDQPRKPRPGMAY